MKELDDYMFALAESIDIDMDEYALPSAHGNDRLRWAALIQLKLQQLKELNSEYVRACIDSHENELRELKDDHGCSNVCDFYYSPHTGTWILKFHVGDDQEFDTKKEMIEWIINEGQE